MFKKIIFILVIFTMLFPGKQKEIESANFNEETTTAFALLGISPATINNFGSAKEIKADWFYKNGSLVDTIAVEFKPMWYIAMKDKNYKEYQNMRYISKRLADTSMSLGMDTKNKTNRFAAISINVNLYRKADPLLDKDLLQRINSVYLNREKAVLKSIMRKEFKAEMASSEKEKEEIKQEIKELEKELEQLSVKEKDRVENIVKTYKDNNWNGGFLNMGYGNVQKFVFNSANNDFSIDANELRNMVWLHYGFPLGRVALLSILNRGFVNEYRALNGINTRFRLDEKNTFFLEILNDYYFKENKKTKYDIAFGGSFKISKAYVNIGFTMEMNNKFKYVNIKPKYDISFRR